MAMTPNYGLSASLRGVTVNPLDPCRLPTADLDVQEAVNAKLSDRVKGGLTHAVSHLNGLTVKSHAEDVWSALRNPIQLEQDTWLLLNIDTVGHRGFSKDGHIVKNTLEITAHPVIVYGAEPLRRPRRFPRSDRTDVCGISRRRRCPGSLSWKAAKLSRIPRPGRYPSRLQHTLHVAFEPAQRETRRP